MPPVAHLAVFGGEAGDRCERPYGRAADDPTALHQHQRAELAASHDALRRKIFRALALLEAKSDGLRGVGLARRGEQPLDARDIRARRLLAVDVLARLHGGLEVLGVQPHRRRDQHRVDIRLREQLAVVFEHARPGRAGNLRLGLVDALGIKIAERGDPCSRIVGEDRAVEAAAVAGPDDPDRDR